MTQPTLTPRAFAQKWRDNETKEKAASQERGLADVPTFAQVKRFAVGNNVEASVIGRLRGALPVEAQGIVITTSDFTKHARYEATMTGLKPIALVNGTELIDLVHSRQTSRVRSPRTRHNSGDHRGPTSTALRPTRLGCHVDVTDS